MVSKARKSERKRRRQRAYLSVAVYVTSGRARTRCSVSSTMAVLALCSSSCCTRTAYIYDCEKDNNNKKRLLKKTKKNKKKTKNLKSSFRDKKRHNGNCWPALILSDTEGHLSQVKNGSVFSLTLTVI